MVGNQFERVDGLASERGVGSLGGAIAIVLIVDVGRAVGDSVQRLESGLGGGLPDQGRARARLRAGHVVAVFAQSQRRRERLGNAPFVLDIHTDAVAVARQ